MKKYLLKPGIFKQKRQLTITSDYIEFLKDGAFKRMYKKDIVDIRFYYEYLRWSTWATYGIKYRIGIKDKHDHEMDIVFKQYLSSKESGFYEEIINDLNTLYLQDITAPLLHKLRAKETITIGGLIISPNEIQFSGTGISFQWNDLAIEKHPTYYIFSRKSAPEFKLQVYTKEWNSLITMSIIETFKEHPQ